ncbi:MAG TPA: hypothetical protein VG167_01375 [Verrucomicrobiae bacterium]|nr:hypothetical protein [Verrucomicrobiae bacterium]
MKTDPTTSDLALNLWAYIDESSCMVYALAGKAYALPGRDEDKLAVLQQLAPTDHLTAKRHPLPKRFTVTDGQQKREGMAPPQIIRDNVADTFEGVFQFLDTQLPPIPDFLTERHTPQRIPQEPLFVFTFLREDDQGNITPLTTRELSRQFAVDQMKRDMMRTLGFSEADAERAAQQWAAEQDQPRK